MNKTRGEKNNHTNDKPSILSYKMSILNVYLSLVLPPPSHLMFLQTMRRKKYIQSKDLVQRNRKPMSAQKANVEFIWHNKYNNSPDKLHHPHTHRSPRSCSLGLTEVSLRTHVLFAGENREKAICDRKSNMQEKSGSVNSLNVFTHLIQYYIVS